MPDKRKPFQVETNASKFATEAVLKQQDSNGDWHPCRYLSQSLDQAQQNYDIYDRELLGVICALEAWQHYFERAPYPIHILSDHKNLTYFKTSQDLTRCQARWSRFLSLFDLQLEHVPGTHMVQSDTLSRLAHLNEEIKDNMAQVVLPNEWFVKTINTDLQTHILEGTKTDPIAPATSQRTPLSTYSSAWRMEDGLCRANDRIYVLDAPQLRRDLVSQYHDSRGAGHPGQFGTLALLCRDYWWPGMGVFV